MASITQDLKFKHAVIQYSLKHGVCLTNIQKTLLNINLTIDFFWRLG